MLAFDEINLLWISCKKGSAFSGLEVTRLAAWVASLMMHFRFGVDCGGQATAATHHLACKELVGGRVHSDCFNVMQDVGLQLEVHGGAVQVVGAQLPWRVTDKLAERMDHVQGRRRDILCSGAKHLCLAQDATVAVKAGDCNEPHEESALAGVTHQGDHVGSAQDVLVIPSDRLVDAPEELVCALPLPRVW